MIFGAPLKTTFRDGHERRAYARAVIVAKRLLADPGLVEEGRKYLDRFIKGDAHQRNIYVLWTKTLELPAAEIAERLLADDSRGESLRATAPVFSVIHADEIRDQIATSG
jgi:hypothetical protein